MKKNILIAILSLSASVLIAQYDWDEIAVPIETTTDIISWELVEELSDDFNYETPSGSDKGETFNAKWKDGFINTWEGPGNTRWTPDNSKVTEGNLELKATDHPTLEDHNYFSCVTARTQLQYPVYVETRSKLMNSVMANAIWMLSDDSSEEIDIVEGYGASWSESADKSVSWFAKRMHLSHHTFDRSVVPALDYQPPSSETYKTLPDNADWRDEYHTIGVYWRDPFYLEYYVDGEKTHAVSGPSKIDPYEYLDGNGLTAKETIIFSGAAQGWQVTNGVFPTDNELSVEADNTFKVDWIHTYKPIMANSLSKSTLDEKLIYSNPVQDYITIKASANIAKIEFRRINGTLAKTYIPSGSNEAIISTHDLPSGIYIMKVIDNQGNSTNRKIIKS